MLCVLFVEEGSREEMIIKARLDPSDLDRLFPFMEVDSSIIAIGQHTKPIVYAELPEGAYPKVMTEMEVMSLDRCLHINISLKGTPNRMCPVVN